MSIKMDDYVKKNGWLLYYRSIGWSPIPIKSADKRPLVEWQKYQKEIASIEQIQAWRKQFRRQLSVGIVTGRISGIVVVDIEKGGSINDLPPTVCSKTGGGGYHFYYKHPGVPVKNTVRIRELTDIRGDGGYVVVPPSLHKSGNRYEWLVAPGDADFAELPQWVLDKCSETQKGGTDWKQFFNTVNLEGTRNQQAASLSGKILYHLPEEMWDVIGLPALKEWNTEKNSPPMDIKELLATWESIKKAEVVRRKKRETSVEKDKKRNQTEMLMELVGEYEDELELFHNNLKEPYVRIRIDGHNEIWPCKSKMFKRWLAKIFWESFEKAPNSQSLNDATNIIESKACFDGKQYSLHNRIAWHEGAIWYDLADAKWHAVKITADGWEVVDHPPILFRRYSHQLSQYEPIRGGDVKELLNFVNVQDEDQKILMLVWLVACFIPDFPHPIPNIYGSQGSAKSVLSKLLRKLIDPSATEALSFPKDTKELVQTLSHHYCAFFDNVSYLSNEISDSLCKAVTGDGFSKRELYTDEDDVIFVFKRCLGINGINIAGKNPDLLERSILFELQRVPPNQRRQEREILEGFEQHRARIIGGIFDGVTGAMHIKPGVKISSLPRMADFAVWGCAIAEALGYTQEQFLDAYYHNIKSQNIEVLTDSMEATAILKLMEGQDHWKGTASELLVKLVEILTHGGTDVSSEQYFPKKANVLTRRLNQIKVNLADEGIIYRPTIENQQRLIYLKRTPEFRFSSDVAPSDDKNDYDDDFATL
jgi:hypothetical protein